MATERLDDHRFAGLLEAAPDAMVCVDADGRIALVNAQTERLFGYGRDELIGQPEGLLGAQGVLEPGVRLIEKPFSEATLLAKLHEMLNAR